MLLNKELSLHMNINYLRSKISSTCKYNFIMIRLLIFLFCYPFIRLIFYAYSVYVFYAGILSLFTINLIVHALSYCIASIQGVAEENLAVFQIIAFKQI